ncbi:thermoresistant glucokinase family carbohydrate kinase [Deinococcus phoenicis]|uniref:Gluconokinase n=1 Tax=Deinococcus phoenicis TaxID=1476583 RepID=A0A016QQ14_9DEIO|nr:gluconokinase, GntK/IdnK-type [Deinococcus phoenicis]EYB67982.1 thermoresistant glucokinase family carbohydrate kinase [Deinococcus phoenicis]
MRLVMMGVTGSGKTVLGQALARRLGSPFLDADDVHTPQARAQMAAGVGLTDADRAPWLARLRGELLARPDVVLACSALRRAYRDALRVGGVRFLFLNVPEDVLRARLAARSGHYAGAALLPSQFATLEPPGPDEADVLTLDVTAADTPADLARRALAALGAA